MAIAALALTGVGVVQAQQQTPPGQEVGPAPQAGDVPSQVEEPPPPSMPASQPSAPAPVVAETPSTSEDKPKAPVAETPAEPMRRVRSNAAILQGLDKVTAETLRFEAPVGQPIRYKSLVITVKACETNAADEAAPESVAYMTIESQPRPIPGRPPVVARQVFRGWMFASSPGLNPLQHSVYDVWVIACRTAAPSPSPLKR